MVPNVVLLLRGCVRAEDIRLEYPFFNRCSFAILEDGWAAFSVEQDFARLQLVTDFWRISNVNAAFAVSERHMPELIHTYTPLACTCAVRVQGAAEKLRRI